MLHRPSAIHAALANMPEQSAAKKLRILFVTQDEPIYVARFFEIFFQEYDPLTFEICGIVTLRAFHEGPLQTFRRLLPVYGLSGTLRMVLLFLKAKLSGKSIPSLSHAHSIPLFKVSTVNSEEFLDTARNLNPDVIVSVSAPERFKDPLLSIPRVCCVNLHSGRLPEYRGMLPTFWQMMNSEPEIVVSAHEMVTKIDAGGLLARASFSVGGNDSLHTVMLRGKEEGARLVINVLTKILHGERRLTPLEFSKSRYFSYPTRRDALEFRRRGLKFM